MAISIDLAVSAQVNLQRRLDTIAHNVANAGTVGFRAERIDFGSLLSRTAIDPVEFATQGKSRLSSVQGAFRETSNPLDVAVRGDGWLAVQTPTGIAYTRDGRMQISPAGQLQNIQGYPLLDAGGATVQLSPNGGPPEITRSGQVFQQGRRIGGLGVYALSPNVLEYRPGTALVTSDQPAQPIVTFNKVSIHQGFTESSNVNAVEEMASLIKVSRSFDAVSAMMRNIETAKRDAVRELGATS
jgi:flagellar basal-body rod protein FlgF